MKKIPFIVVGILLLILSSCNDFLDINPQGVLTQEAFPLTAEDALLATNAVYATLRNWHYHSGGFPILDIMSDDAYKGSNPNDALNTVGPYDNFTITPTQDGLDRWWAALYEGIKRANVVIENLAEIAMEPDLKERYMAEAKFLRALYYFDLVRAWGAVPLVETTHPPLKLERSEAALIYTRIENDLLSAILALPEKSEYGSDELGRATKGAAKALLAKVYLFQHDYPKAAQYALEVINGSQFYDLEPNFLDANGEQGEHGVESVFEIGAIAIEGSFGNQYANTQGVRGTPNRGWGFNRPSEELRAAFEPDDPRLKATIIDLGDIIDGVTILGDGSTPDFIYDADGNIIERECYNRKVWISGENTSTQFGHNRRIIRFADVLLIAAEALNETNRPAEALTYLNRIRQRARNNDPNILPDITTLNKDELRNIILHERRVELALEGHRYWDLIRTGSAPTVLGPLGFKQGRDELLPIPQNEIDISQGTLTQNPNWN